jgi:hypothetical protein
MNSRTQIVLNVSGGVVQDVFSSDPTAQILLVDWDLEGNAPTDCDIVVLDDNQREAQVADLRALPLVELAGTDVAAAIEASPFAFQ